MLKLRYFYTRLHFFAMDKVRPNAQILGKAPLLPIVQLTAEAL